MPGWVTDLLVPERMFTAALVIFVLWLCVRTLFKSWPFIRKFVGLVNALVGTDEEPGIAKRMDAQADKLGELQERVEKIHHEVTPNHGGSMNDAQRRTEAKVGRLADALDKHISETAEWQPMLRELHATWRTKPRNN
ncbi:hypothetical protein [Glutamicibacter sp. X7]